jgi:hypothetical protein
LNAATIEAWTSATVLPCAVMTAASVVPLTSFARSRTLMPRAFAVWRRMKALTRSRSAARVAFAAFPAFAACPALVACAMPGPIDERQGDDPAGEDGDDLPHFSPLLPFELTAEWDQDSVMRP